MTATAWHLLGHDTSAAATPAAALAAAALDQWNLTAAPACAKAGRRTVDVPHLRMVLRDSARGELDVLGVVSPSYQVRQNEDYLPLLEGIVAECGATQAVAGTIGDARRVFVTTRLPGFTRVGEDEVTTYLTSVHSHDGSLRHRVLVTPCHVRTGALLAVHAVDPSTAAQVVDEAFTYLDTFQTTASQLAGRSLDTSALAKIVGPVLGARTGNASAGTFTRYANKIGGVLDLFDGNTAWRGLVAMADWWDHCSPTRGDDRDGARAENAVLAPKFKDAALKALLQS